MNDDLVSRTEIRRVRAMTELDADRRAELGQFFTPRRAAALIADMPRLPSSGVLRVLDAGAGAGSLTAALVDRILREAPHLQVEVVAVDVDEQVVPYLAETLADCETTAARHGTGVTTSIITTDFISCAGSIKTEGPTRLADCDIVVMNPPYAKLSATSAHRRALARHGVDCPNLYAAFVAVGLMLLRDRGQLVAITPRSFANGPYFEHFRKHLLRSLALDHVHTFESRSTVFADTGVLQENVVFSGTRAGRRGNVTFSVSHGHADVPRRHVVAFDNIVRPDDPHQFLRITPAGGDATAEAMEAMPARLADLDVQVSTGRVVDFRSRENLAAMPQGDLLPLIYPGNLRAGIVRWPRPDIRKPQAFRILNPKDDKLLLPSGWYVLVKRFSAKEERRRIVAAVWDPVVHHDTPVAIENHLNVFHDRGSGLDQALAVGLSFWLNSTLVDQYFRTFSGHTQVNATDLRSLRFPRAEDLRSLGAGRPAELPDQAELDAIVDKYVSRVEVLA